MQPPSLELCSATRRFGELVAVEGVTLDIQAGQLHAIVGENGAGKSTALKMLAGHLAPSSGEVRVNGHVLSPADPREAIGRGIGMVHQHFMLVDSFSVVENLILGSEPTRAGGVLDFLAAKERGQKLVAEAGLKLDLDRPTHELSVGERQRLEILRVLFRGARSLLLDEPTSVLSPVEIEDLYRTLRRLVQGGTSVGLVTHRLDEVIQFCDVVSVLRRGKLVLTRTIRKGGALEVDAPTLADKLTRAIMGGEPPALASPAAVGKDAPIVLELRGVELAHPQGGDRLALDGLNLTLRAGEMLGIAGIEGNGQRELVRALAGLAPLAKGEIHLDGKLLHGSGSAMPPAGPARARFARQNGLVVVHEDRHADELLLDATLADNLVFGDLGRVAESDAVARRLERFGVFPPEPLRAARELSGGNQQKVVLARALDRPIRALVLAQPTRGVDIGTARIVHRAILEVASRGAGVIVVSANLNELRSVSHRIAVLRRGRLAAEFAPDASDEDIGRAMLSLKAS